MAHWQIYGSQGVMIQSTPDRVRSALQPIFNPEEKTAHSVGRVVYQTVSTPRSYSDLTTSPLLTRPYYVKECSYFHEREVRFVIGVNPDGCSLTQDGGVSVKLDPEVLIERATISPQVLGSEAETLVEIFGSLQQNLKVERSPLAGRASEQRWGLEKALSECMDSPFHLGRKESDDAAPVPPGLFGDV